MIACLNVKRWSLLLLLSHLSCVTAGGQSSLLNFKIKNLDINGQRHQINKILPNKSFAWVISNNGILKFNGEGFIQIYFDENFDSYPSNFLQDKNHNIWILNPTKQNHYSVEIFLAQEQKIIPIHSYIDTNLISFEKEKIHKYFQDDHNNIWFIYTDGSVLRFDRKVEKFGKVDLLDFVTIEQVYDEIAILNFGNIEFKDSLCNLKKILYNDFQNLSIKESRRHDYTIYSKRNDPWPSIEISFWKNDIKLESIERQLIPTSFKENEIIYHDRSDCLINFRNNKIEIEERKTGKTKIIDNVTYNHYLTPKSFINDNILFPTKEKIGIIEFSDYKFHNLNLPSGISTRDIQFLNDTTIYIATYGGQILYNLKDSSYVSLNSNVTGYGMEIIDNDIAIQPSLYSKLFITHLEGKDTKFSSIKFDSFKNSSGVLKLPVYHKESNTLFLATRYHLIKIEDFLPIKLNYHPKYIPLDIISNINDVIKAEEKVYFASDLKICSLDDNGNIIKIPIEYSKQGFSCIKFHNDKFYIGTKTGRILILDKTFKILDHITYEKGLHSSTIYTIEIDAENNIWCGTEQGLILIADKNQRVIQFTEEEGMPANDFNYNSSNYKDGKMYFGTINGIVYFDPKEIIESFSNSDIKLIHADESKLSDPKKFSLIKNYNFTFGPNTSTLRLFFGSKSKGLINQNMLDYQITGIDKSWVNTSDGLIEINGLPYGQHDLVIRNNYSINDTKTIHINSTKLYFQKWRWFLILGIFLLAILSSISYYYARFFKARTESLVIEVEKRTHEINKQKEKLLQSNNAKDKIFSILAHDLKTPINNLSSLNETIEYLLNENRLEELKAVSTDVKNKTSAIKNLVDNLLHWSLQEQDKIFLSKNRFKIIGPIDNILTQFKNQINTKKLIVITEISNNHELNADYAAFEAVVRNLISNAIKFSYKEGTLHILSKATEKQLEIQVIDNGTGIDAKQINNIKNQSYISTLGPYNEKGIGIGLMLSFYFIEKMNGAIKFKNNNKQGTIVKLIFYNTIDKD